MKSTVVFDFDGVIHSYTSGWQGAAIISDPPVPGIREAISSIRDAGYEVIINSSRAQYWWGEEAIRKWLQENDIVVDGIAKEKPPAIVYIDDRAICFRGHPETLLNQIQTFVPWTHSSR